MANIQRTLWSALTQEANSTTVFIPGTKALLSGTFPIFWPLSLDGKTYRGTPVVEYRVRLSTGNDVSCATLPEFTDASGLTIALGGWQDSYQDHRYVTVSGSNGSVGILELSVIVQAPVDNSFTGLTERVAALEEASGGAAVPPNPAIADITATSIAAATKPTGSADVATLEGKLGPIIDALNVNRSVTMDMRTKFNQVLKALEDHGILLP